MNRPRQGSELMREGLTRMALWRVLVVCVAMVSISTAVASAASAHRGHVASAKHANTPKLGSIHLKLFDTVAPGLEYKGWLYTDGVRWAAYEHVRGVTRIIDTKTGHTESRPDPTGCSGGLIAVGGGEMLYECANPECPGEVSLCNIKPEEKYATARLIVENILTGTQVAVAGQNHLPSHSYDEGAPTEMEAIGSNWAMGRRFGYRASTVFFVNWHTGAIINQEEGPARSNKLIENLNNASLLQPLCPPLTRPQSEYTYSPGKYAPVVYDPPFALAGADPLDTVTESVPLQLVRCGSRRRELLPGSGVSAQIGGGVLSWLSYGEPTNIYVTRLRAKGNQWHGRFYPVEGLARREREEHNTLVQHTSTMIFVTRFGHPSKIYAAQIP